LLKFIIAITGIFLEKNAPYYMTHL